MKMLDCHAKLSCIKLGLFFRKCNLASQMETEISSRTVVKSKIKIVRSLEGKVKVDDELMVRLFENIGLDDSIFQLFLKNQIFFLESF